MSSNQINSITEAISIFLSENQQSFEIISNFKDQLINFTKDSFDEIIQLIKDHSNIFFKDHSTTFSFLYIIINSLFNNFLKFELVLNIVITFSTEIRRIIITDYELFTLFNKYPNSINYLFNNNFFTIGSITKYSILDDLTFIMFLPEITQHDSEYSKLREAKLNFSNKKSLQSLFELVKKDPEQHIKNRNMNFHPSSLHQAIRNDDIEMFQSILSKNNISINHQIEFSFYERSHMIDSDLSLIQVAATYSSINIFKFLWMQNDIILNENLLQYAFFSGNSEIIHLCENKLSHKDVIEQAIYSNKLDLLNYYIDNFSDKIKEEDELTRNALKKIECEKRNNLYDCLTFKDLCFAAKYLSIPIIQSCLYKMCFIVKNVDCQRTSINNTLFLLESSIVHFDLFKFLYSQIDDRIEYSILCSMHCLNRSVILKANDSFKFLLNELKRFINPHELFIECLKNNIDLANYLLDLRIEELNSNNKKRSIINVNYGMIFHDLIMVIDSFYNEDVVIKMIKLNNFFMEDKSIELFISYLLRKISVKMILSLFSRLYSIISKDILLKMATRFEKLNYTFIAEMIKQNL